MTSPPSVVVFGTGDVAQIAAFYFERDALADVIAFTVDEAYLDGIAEFEGKPLVAFETVAEKYPPEKHQMFVALSYSEMNRLRAHKCAAAKAIGYELASYISPHCTYLSQFRPGENAFIFEDNTVQPFVRIGDNVILWAGNHIGHHSVIENDNFVSSHVVISGHCHIEPNCFLGVNSTLAHNTRLAAGTLLGAGVTITRDTEAGGVYVGERATKLDRTSDQVKL